MFLKLFSLIVVFNGAFCADSRNIFQYLSDNSQYSTLVSLLKLANLEGALQTPGALTLLAPTNSAFSKVPQATLNELQNDKDKLKTVLTFHVVNQTLISPLIGDGAAVTSLNGQKVTFHKNGSAVYANGAYLSATDIIVDNGVIHSIDSVLMPATENLVQYLAKNDKVFSDLFAAIIVANLEKALESGEFTMFAPTDTAFSKIKTALPGDVSSLSNILKYHVVPGVYPSDLLKDGMVLHTLAGKDLKVSIKNGVVKVGSATVTTADVAATNGVLHIIDTVQVP